MTAVLVNKVGLGHGAVHLVVLLFHFTNLKMVDWKIEPDFILGFCLSGLLFMCNGLLYFLGNPMIILFKILKIC